MIELFDGYFVRVDENCYSLQRRTGRKDKKTGKDVTKVYGYYTGLEGALKRLAKELAMERHRGGLYGLREAIDAIRESNEKVEQYIKSEVGDG